MACDEGHAERIREILVGSPNFCESRIQLEGSISGQKKATKRSLEVFTKHGVTRKTPTRVTDQQ